MTINPDVNRLSLEERVRALEAKSPSGGGSLVTGSASEAIIDPRVVDQCPENAVTDIGSGIMWRLDIANLGALSFLDGSGTPNLTGIGMKLATFYPRIQGVLSFRYSSLIRMDVAPYGNFGGYSSITTLRLHPSFFNYSAVSSSIVDKLPGQGGRDVTLRLFPTSMCCGRPRSGSTPVLTLNNMVVDFMAKETGRTANLRIMISTPASSSSVTAGVSWGFYRAVPEVSQPLQDFGDIVVIGGGPGWEPYAYGRITTATAQDLPDYYKPIYPTSWYA